MSKFTIYFGGKELPSFVKVKAVGFSTLPAVNHNFKQIQGGGNIKSATLNLGAKLFTVDFIVIKDADKSLTEMAREFAVWCIGNSFGLTPLQFADDLDVVYKAVVSNNVEINDAIYTGEGTIEFTVPNGISMSANPNVIESVDGKAICDYSGSAPATPTIEFIPSENLSNADLTFTNIQTGDRLYLKGNFTANERILIDCTKKVVKRGNSLDLKLIQLDSEWLRFVAPSTYEIVCNVSKGAFTVSYNVNNF